MRISRKLPTATRMVAVAGAVLLVLTLGSQPAPARSEAAPAQARHINSTDKIRHTSPMLALRAAR